MEKKNSLLKNGNDPLVTIVIIIIAAAILTYIIPAGEFAQATDDAGNAIIDLDTFTFMESTPISLLSLPKLMVSAFQSAISIIVLIGAGGGAFEIIRGTGAMDAVIGLTLEKTQGKEKSALWIVSFIFSLLACTLVPQVFIPFTPMCIALAMALGYDDFTGIALLVVSTGVGAIGAPIAAGTVAAQSMLGLPSYSGLLYRFVIMVIFYLVSTAYLVHYAERARKDPTKSVVYGMDESRREKIAALKINEYPKFTPKFALVIVAMILCFAVMIYGGYVYNWGNFDIASVFLVMGIVCGLLGKMSLTAISKGFVNGVKGLTGTFIIIGLATSVTSILNGGNIINTIIYYMCKSLSSWPVFLTPIGILLAIGVINIFVPSLNGKMPLIFPILSPVCKVLGINQQLLCVTYTFGDSFTNFLLPYQSALVGFLETGHATFGHWIKFFKGLIFVWFAIGSVVLIVLQVIGIGPF